MEKIKETILLMCYNTELQYNHNSDAACQKGDLQQIFFLRNRWKQIAKPAVFHLYLIALINCNEWGVILKFRKCFTGINLKLKIASYAKYTLSICSPHSCYFIIMNYILLINVINPFTLICPHVNQNMGVSETWVVCMWTKTCFVRKCSLTRLVCMRTTT